MGEAHLHIDTFSPDDSYRVDLLLEDAGDPLLVKKKKKKSLGSIEVEFSFDFISQSQFNHVSDIVRKCPSEDHVAFYQLMF